MSECGVVIDLGSANTRFGFAGNDVPSSFPTVVGLPRSSSYGSSASEEFYVGKEAIDRMDSVAWRFPVERGLVADWSDAEKVVRHVLKSSMPTEKKILFTEPPFNPKSNREKMVQLTFEKLAFDSCFVQLQSVLSLYASGRTTGLVCECGEGVTFTTPVYEGYNSSHAILREDIAGRDITDYLISLMSQNGYRFPSSTCRESARLVKENLAYISLDYDTESATDKSYVLPDGQTVTLGRERFQCTEPIFRPSLLGLALPGVHELIYSSITKSDVDIRKDLSRNIVLSGGATNITGYSERLQKELHTLVPTSMMVKVIAPEDRKISTWIGGSILASLSTFQSMWVSKEEYNETGPSVVLKKCAHV
ncbi:actin 11 [Pelomyxa schiedti]|nr:actin 11 [Pelomyxa schiedti]